MNPPDLKGYCMPLSPRGKAQLIGGLPWHYSMALMSIHYQADPVEIQKLLPEPYELSAEEPGSASVWLSDTLSVWDADRDMVFVNPERAQYKECLLIIRCRFKGVEGVRCPYNWVDNDFTLLRGWFHGFPKKLARLHLGHSKAALHELNKGIGKVGDGTKFKSFVEAHGERLVTGTMKLAHQISPSKLPPPFGLPWFNILHFPSTDIDSDKPLVHQVVQTVVEPPNFGEVWAAEDATLVFTESELEEHTAIKPIEITGAYYVNMGLTTKGTKVVHNY